jgi:hypothetical protein
MGRDPVARDIDPTSHPHAVMHELDRDIGLVRPARMQRSASVADEIAGVVALWHYNLPAADVPSVTMPQLNQVVPAIGPTSFFGAPNS